VMVPESKIQLISKRKAFVDYLIKHKIFSKEDIYTKVFPSEKAFDNLKKKFADYKKLYKEVEGVSY